MKYGIKETKDGIFCANCGQLITKDEFYSEEFCPNCGAPLTAEAIKLYEERIKEGQKLVLDTIEQALPKYNINKIIGDLKEELTENNEI